MSKVPKIRYTEVFRVARKGGRSPFSNFRIEILIEFLLENHYKNNIRVGNFQTFGMIPNTNQFERVHKKIISGT